MQTRNPVGATPWVIHTYADGFFFVCPGILVVVCRLRWGGPTGRRCVSPPVLECPDILVVVKSGKKSENMDRFGV